MSGNLSQPEYHDFICNLHDFIELMGNQYDTLSCVPQFHQGFKQLYNLLGSKHGRGFIHNQKVSPKVKGFQDFHTLLQADRYILNQRFGRDLQLILFTDIQNHLFRLLHVQKPVLFLYRLTKYHVLCYRKGWDQCKMLVYHTYPHINGIFGAFKPYCLSINQYFASIRLIHSVKYTH